MKKRKIQFAAKKIAKNRRLLGFFNVEMNSAPKNWNSPLASRTYHKMISKTLMLRDIPHQFHQ